MSSRQFKRAMKQKMALQVIELDDSSSEEDSAPVKANAFAMFDSDTESEDESDEEDAHQCEKAGDPEPTVPPPTPETIAKSDDTQTAEKVETSNRKKKNQKKKRRGKNKKRGKGKKNSAKKKASADASIDMDFLDSFNSTTSTIEAKDASASSVPTATTAPAASSSAEPLASSTGASLAVNTRFLNDEYELKQVRMQGGLRLAIMLG